MRTARRGRRAEGAAGVAGVAVRIAALLAGEVAAVVFLHRLGSAPGFALPRDDPGGWLRDTPALDATAAVLRVAALVAAGWLLASTLWWLLAAARGVRRRTGGPAMPGTRRLVEWALTLTLAGGFTLAAPAAGAAGPAPTTTTTTTTPGLVLEPVDRRATTATTAAAPTGVRTGRGLAAVPPASTAAPPTPSSSAPAPATPDTATPETATPETATPETAAPEAATPATVGAAGAVHVIAPGENLWVIAAARVGELTGRPAAAVPVPEIAPYWRRLCELNRTSIRSGNPSLVYPGEVLQLPPGSQGDG